MGRKLVLFGTSLTSPWESSLDNKNSLPDVKLSSSLSFNFLLLQAPAAMATDLWARRCDIQALLMKGFVGFHQLGGYQPQIDVLTLLPSNNTSAFLFIWEQKEKR